MKKYRNFIGVCVVMVALSGCSLPGMGTPERKQVGEVLGGILRSSDGGRTFEPRNFIEEDKSLDRADVSEVAIDPFNTNVLYAGTAQGGLFKSIDAGETWQSVDFEPRGIQRVATSQHKQDTVYVSAYIKDRGRVYKTIDAGETWDEIYVEPIQGTFISALAISPRNANIVYIGTTKLESNKTTVAKTIDGGQTWLNIYTGNDTIRSIFFDAGNDDTIYINMRGSYVFRSQDQGQTWVDLRGINPEDKERVYPDEVYSFMSHSRESGVLFIGTKQGIFRSNDYGDTWASMEVIASTKGTPIWTMAVSPHDSERITYAADKVVYAWTGQGWTVTDMDNRRDVRTITYDPFDPDVVYLNFYERN